MGYNKFITKDGGVLLDLTSDTVAADKLMSGVTTHDKSGNEITGTMKNNGAISSTMDGINTKSVTVPAGYTSGGTVSLDSTIDDEVDAQTDLINQIATALEGKAAGAGEDLDSVITELETKVSTLNTTLDGKAAGGSGGGSLETCSVAANLGAWCYVIYVTTVDGMIQQVLLSNPSDGGTFEITNVVKGTTVIIYVYDSFDASCENCSLIDYTITPHDAYLYRFEITGDATIFG